MFSISVAFLIFGGTSINLQIQLIKDFQAKFIGADMAVVVFNFCNKFRLLF
jgi:hypothetical protein